MQTRKLILERAGHKVVAAMGELEIATACSAHDFDVAVIGQAIPTGEKHRVLHRIRQDCPAAKVLELYSPLSGRILKDADDWLEVPANIPSDLAERVSALATKAQS